MIKGRDMHALIYLQNGSYYTSAVYGYYIGPAAIREGSERYWIVWNSSKTRLIRWPTMVPEKEYLVPQIFIVDSDQSNWIINDDNDSGCVDFLTIEFLNSFLDQNDQPEDILKKCRNADPPYIYQDTREIKNKKDIEDLDWISMGFHDAFLTKKEFQEDGSLYLALDGIWSCELEIWFSGEIECHTATGKNGEEYDLYWDWQGATILIHEGFIYFVVDEPVTTVTDLKSDCCYFKARHLKYRITPHSL